MKKTRWLSALALTLSFTACTAEKTDVPKANDVQSIISVETENSPVSFDSCNGIVYLAYNRETSENIVYEAQDETQEDIIIPIQESVIAAYDYSGAFINEYSFDETLSPLNLVFDGKETFYYTAYKFHDGQEMQTLFKYTAGDESAEQVHVFEDCTRITKTELCGDTLYVLGIYNRELEAADDGYYDSGEQLVSLSLSDYSETILMKNGVIDFSKLSDEKIMVYAHGSEGFYCTVFNGNTKSFETRCEKNFGMTLSFCAADEEKIIYSSGSLPCGTAISKMSSDSYAEMFDDRRFLVGKSELDGEKYFFLYNDKLGIADVSQRLNADFERSIKIVSAEYVSDMPGSFGYTLDCTQLGNENFALTVLSRDKCYDLCIMNSREDFSANIRDKGSFYPLNDIPAVQEYLNSCFPFVKEAAINSDGDIWMLPIDVKVASICYDEQLCAEAGITFTDNMTLEQLIDNVNRAYIGDTLTYYIGAEYCTEIFLSDYLACYEKFDTPHFRALAEVLKNKIYGNYEAFSSNKKIEKVWATGNTSNVAFTVLSDGYDYNNYSSVSKKVVNMPSISGTGNIANCVFLCVNPDSEQLDKTLEYISELANSLRINDKNLSVRDAAVYSSDFFESVSKVYSSGYVRFSLDNEIFLSNFYEYTDDKITLDEFIAEADRKLAAYLNE